MQSFNQLGKFSDCCIVAKLKPLGLIQKWLKKKISLTID